MTNDEQELADIEELSESLSKSLPKSQYHKSRDEIAIGKIKAAIKERRVDGKLVSVRMNWLAINQALDEFDEKVRAGVLKVVAEYSNWAYEEIYGTTP